MVNSTQSSDLSNPSSENIPDITIDELQQFADLLMLIRQQYPDEHRMKDVKTALDGLENKKHPDPACSGNSFDRWIGRIALYLRVHGSDLLHPWTSKKRRTDEQIDERLKSFVDKKGPWSDPESFRFPQEHWIRDFMIDLKRCFVDLDDNKQPEKRDEQGRYELRLPGKHTTTPTRQFDLLFWHWTKYTSAADLKERLGTVVTGQLIIYDDWKSANFSYALPSGKRISYSGPVSTVDRNSSTNPIGVKNHYLVLETVSDDTTTDQSDLLKQVSRLTIVLTVKTHHADNTVLEGSFVAADPLYGYPASGRVFLIGETYLQPDSKTSDVQRTDLQKQRADLIAFGQQYVAYQTQTAPVPNGGSFANLNDIPGYTQWAAHRGLLENPLYGYFVKTIHDEDNQTKRHLSRFEIHPNKTDPVSPPFYINYLDSPNTLIDYGFLTVEQAEGDGQITYRGAFHYLAQQQRLRYQIHFIRSQRKGHTWYIGTTSGLNRHRKEILTGRFVVTTSPLEEKWLEPKHLAELLFHQEPTVGTYLLQTDQQIPSETVPLFHQLRWPHLPQIVPTNSDSQNPLAFNKWVEGEYGCYALVRKRAGNQSEYHIAFYPVHISADGYVKIKYEIEKGYGEGETLIQYEGRAFSTIDSNRLYIYIDQAHQHHRPLQASFYFSIKAGDELKSAYGVSNQFGRLDEPPEAKFEALIKLKGISFDDARPRLFDPFSEKDRVELDKQEPNLALFMAGRANRLILATRQLTPNLSIPEQIRQDTFRRLHIRAALYEIRHGDYKDTENWQELLRDSYLHGFGIIQNDIDYLEDAFSQKSGIWEILKRWRPENREKLMKEIKRLWPNVTFANQLQFST